MTTVQDLQKQFHCCMPLFIALGDKVRLSIVELLTEAAVRSEDPQGTIEKKAAKVIEGEALDILVGSMPLEAKTEEEKKTKELVQANVLKILKDAGLVGVRQDGTANYYYLTLRDSTRSLMELGYRLEEFM